MSTEGQGFVSIFEQNKGRAASVNIDNAGKPYFPFILESTDGSQGYSNATGYNRALNGVVMELAINKQENVAINPTLGSEIYLYVGGETACEISMSGFAFCKCDNKESANHGIINVINYYYKQNVAKTGKACKLILGGGDAGECLVYTAYLISFNIEAIYKMENTFRFTFRFYAIKK